MKILTIADFFYPETVGGSAIMAYELMRELVERGNSVTVLTRQQRELGSTDSIGKMRVFRYRLPEKQALYPLAVWRAYRIVNKLLTREHFDLINIHHASGGFAAELARRRLGNRVPSIFFFQGPWHREAIAADGRYGDFTNENRNLPAKYLLRREADKFILKNCSAFITLSDYMFDQALEIHPELAHKHRKIPGGVNIERFCPEHDMRQLRRELSLPEDRIILLTIRRLAPRMGLENLVKAMRLVEDARDDVILIICGRGTLTVVLRKLIKELRLERTHLAGYISDDELPKYYQVSDLFVMPSVTLEGFGLSTLEALSCGVPVLGTPMGGTPEILRQILPEFILPGVAPEEIAEGILAKIDCLRDQVIKGNVRQFAEGFSWERVTDLVQSLFEDTVSRN